MVISIIIEYVQIMEVIYRNFVIQLVKKLRLNGYIIISWDLSSAGRASALQAEGHRFEPYRSHSIL